jgi:signal peptidase II
MRRVRTLVGLALVIALAIGIDQTSKWMIVNVIMQPPRIIEITPYFNIVLIQNTGVSFGMFGGFMADRQVVLIALNLAIVAGLLAWAWGTEIRSEKIGLGTICGGALGNIADRWREGGVTDFLDFHLADWHWPAFNFADVAIFVGFSMLLIQSLRPAPQAKSKERLP